MPAARRRSWSAAPLVAAAVLVPVLAVPSPARAEPPADTVVGELVQAWAEPDGAHAEEEPRADDGLLTWIETDDGDAVRVPTEDLADELPDVAPGATVEVTVGDEVDDAPAGDHELEPAREVLAAEVLAAAEEPAPTAPATALTDEVTVVMTALPGATPDATLAEVVQAVNGPVAAFWSAQSGGAVRIGAAAANVDWWQPTGVDCSNPAALWNAAAARAGWSRGPGRHLLVYLPYGTPGCAYGLAEVGTSLTGGGRLYVTDVATSVIAHELGHNFGLGHSSARQCSSALETGTCRTRAYYDFYDVMGMSWDQVGSLSAAHSARLGLLPADAATTVTASSAGGTYTLAPLSGSSGTRAVRLLAADGAVYWLEHRTAGGQDAWLGTSANWPRLQTGVLLRRAVGGSDTSWLLDGTPSASSGWDGDMRTALPVGTAVRVAGGDFTVTVQSATATGAVVRIATADPPRLARTPENGAVYLVSGGTRHLVPDLTTLAAYSALGPVTFVAQGYLDGIPEGPRLGRVVTDPGGGVWFVDAGIKLPFASCAQVADYGAACGSIVRLEQPLIDAFVTGPVMTSVYRTTSGKAFVVSGGVKREVVDDAALAAAGWPTAGVRLLESGLGHLPYGVPITRDGVVLRNRSTGAVTVAAEGTFTALSHAVWAATPLSSWPVRSLDDAGMRQLPTTPATGALLRERGGSAAYLVSQRGRVLVADASMLPGSVPEVPAAVLAALPEDGSLAAGTFVKGSQGAGVYA
ncbi:reprolysin-like metallopeptidase, partial [Geodermatophilus sp. SYSU D00815]